MSPTQPLPPKKEVALVLLERSSVFIHLDPRPPAVVVPARLKNQPRLVLQVGLNMQVPIPDLQVDEQGVRCTLSFNRSPFFCIVPWSSVFAMVSEQGQGLVWPDDVPAEVTKQPPGRPAEAQPRKDPPKAAVAVGAPLADAKAEGRKAKRPRKRPALAAVPEEAVSSSKGLPARSAEETEAPPSPRSTANPTPAARASEGLPKRRKRELPPYLRVVK
jgi:hypothetical protein